MSGREFRRPAPGPARGPGRTVLARLRTAGFKALAWVRSLPTLLLLSAAALASGAALYPLAAVLNRLLAARLTLGPFLSVLPEEALKFGLALAALAAARRFKDPSLCLLAVAGATAFGALENLAYALSFPDSAVYLRLGWALPLHANAGALFALALSSRRPVAAGLGAFVLSAAIHAAFNALASAYPSAPVLAGGLLFNFIACAGLAAAAYTRFAWGGVLHGSSRL